MPREFKSFCFFVGLIFLLSSGIAKALDIPFAPTDPFGTHDEVSDTPGRSAVDVGSDPCLKEHPKHTKWNLIDVIEQSLCHNPQTKQAWASARAQASLLGSAESGFLPSLNLSVPISESQNTQGGGLVGGTAVPTQNMKQSQTLSTRISPIISINYLLFDFGGRMARVENARQTLEAANWTHASTLQNVLFAAIQSYYQYFAAYASLEASEATEKLTKGSFDVAAARFDEGAAPLSDKLQAKNTYEQAKVARQTASGNARAALGALANAMGLKPTAELQFDEPVLSGPVEEREKDVQALIDLAKASRPDLAAAEAQVKASEANVLMAKSANMPNLSLVGNYNYYMTVDSSSISSWQVGVQVSVPLFTGFNNTYQIKNAEEQVEVSAQQREQIDQQISMNVWQAYYTLEATRENLKNTEQLLDNALQTEKVTLGRYQEGVGNIVELLNAESNLANARYQYVQAHFNWRIGKAQLAQALGRLDLDEVSAVQGYGIHNKNPKN